MKFCTNLLTWIVTVVIYAYMEMHKLILSKQFLTSGFQADKLKVSMGTRHLNEKILATNLALMKCPKTQGSQKTTPQQLITVAKKKKWKTNRSWERLHRPTVFFLNNTRQVWKWIFTTDVKWQQKLGKYRFF